MKNKWRPGRVTRTMGNSKPLIHLFIQTKGRFEDRDLELRDEIRMVKFPVEGK